jgi:hypothetical protein
LMVDGRPGNNIKNVNENYLRKNGEKR